MSEYIVHVNVDRAGRQCAAVTNRGQLFIWDIGHSGMMIPTEVASTNISLNTTNFNKHNPKEDCVGHQDLPTIEGALQSQIPLDIPGPSLIDENVQQRVLNERTEEVPDITEETSVEGLKRPNVLNQINPTQKSYHALAELAPLNIPSQIQQPPSQHSLTSVSNNTRPFARLRAHPTFALKCRFRPDGMAIATTSADQTTKLWSLSNHTLLNTYTVPGNKWVWDCAFTNDSKYMITATSDGLLRMWDVDSAEIMKSYQGHSMGVTAMAFYDCS